MPNMQSITEKGKTMSTTEEFGYWACARCGGEVEAHATGGRKDDCLWEPVWVSMDTTPTGADDRDAGIYYCPVHGDLLAGPRSLRCSEAPKGHEFRHPQPETVTEAQVEAAARILHGHFYPEPSDEIGGNWLSVARAQLHAAAAVAPTQPETVEWEYDVAWRNGAGLLDTLGEVTIAREYAEEAQINHLAAGADGAILGGVMGMFDSLYDGNDNEWQTKAFACILDRFELGQTLPAPSDADVHTYQVEVLGEIDGEYVNSFATVRDDVLRAVPAERDTTMPRVDYSGWLIEPGEA